MKLSTLLFASVLGATVMSAAGTASADRYVRGYGYGHSYGYGYTRGYNRVVVGPAYRPWRWSGFAPRYVVERPVIAPYAPVIVERPAVVVRPAPVVVRPRYWHGPVVVRGGYRRW